MNKNIIIYTIAGILLLGLILLLIFPNMTYVLSDLGKKNSGTKDICSVPEGTSQEEWYEHMSHHPNMYKGCL